ncbi:FHA domain-containing protein FhaB/FipA [Longivirga aurantiaca]|uniref:FHA domain-containing protein n=1 Tax=Longivirga aurantiaca TaxID=1837743 RepID=A0ABW1T569_9ACTN
MSELLLTLLRLGFLALVWLLVIVAILVLRRDLKAPRDARMLVPARVPRGGQAPAAPRAPKAPKAAKGGARSLVVVEGPLTGTVIPLGAADVTIGRAPDSTLVLDDDYASNNHARISLTGSTWIVTDLGSTNGTWVDRSRITSPTPLSVGHQLKVGRTVLELRK